MGDKLPNLNFFSRHNVALNAQLYNLQTAEKYRKNFAPILNSHLIDYLNDWIHRFIKPKIFILCQLGMYFARYLQIVYDKINSDFTSIFL